MAKDKVVFICQQCGYESLRFMGKCPSCKEWNSFVETVVSTKTRNPKSEIRKKSNTPVSLSEIKTEKVGRMKIGIEELDQVLGGGLVPGQVLLLAGEPGVGKSTLLLQLVSSVSKRMLVDDNLFGHDNKQTTTRSKFSSPSLNHTILYISGEESPEQISLRAERLEIKDKESRIQLLAETNVDSIVEQIVNSKQQTANSKKNNFDLPFTIYDLLIMDSIQTVATEDLTGTAGSIGQVRECARRIIATAKNHQIPAIIVGHVTKEGAIAGPKVLEHLVDTVLYMEGQRFERIRLVRVAKNRFGPTDEVGVFEMGQKGFAQVDNPSELFFERKDKNPPGSAVVVVLEGTRPLLVEVQALVSHSDLKSPRRVGNGINFNRLLMISAILSKHMRLPLERFDIYASISGGLRVDEPAVDLAVAAAIYSSFKNKALPENSAFIGELTLLGEIRKAMNMEKREREAKKLGFKNVISSKNYTSLKKLLGEI